MDFQQSQTLINLQIAYKNELETSSKNNIFGIQAGNENQLRISDIFSTVSRNNRFIANRLRRLLNGGNTTSYENLLESSEDERYAQKNIYLEYSQIALQEGYTDISSLFNGISNIKLNHSFLTKITAADLKNNELYCKKDERTWVCLGCGNIMSGLCAPEICPICGYPQTFYELFLSL
ncbi:MAG: rubrerythrin family protein [Lachnotalea sp.]